MENNRVDMSKCPGNNKDFAKVTAFNGRIPQIRGGSIYLFIKRDFDLTASVIAILLFLIPGILLAALIKLESPGPVIYKQDRLGKNGTPFTIFKFRSMYQDAEEYGPQWAEIHDKRCTKIGRIIRRYHIDELPQFFNIVCGEMSLVGPRPEREFYYKKFDAYLPMFKERLLVKPGRCVSDAETPAWNILCDGRELH